MKTLTKTVKALILAALLTFAFNQSFASDVPKDPEQILADETFYKESGTKAFKVITSNYDIKEIIEKKFDGIVVKMSMSYKKDRYGRYKEYTYTFSNENKKQVIDYLKGL